MVKTAEQLRKRYPKGTCLRLKKPLDDPFTPKSTGDVMVVDYIDDMGQIHGRWKSGGSIALLFGVDDFETVRGY